jgi:hypothetical protein
MDRNKNISLVIRRLLAEQDIEYSGPRFTEHPCHHRAANCSDYWGACALTTSSLN